MCAINSNQSYKHPGEFVQLQKQGVSLDEYLVREAIYHKLSLQLSLYVHLYFKGTYVWAGVTQMGFYFDFGSANIGHTFPGILGGFPWYFHRKSMLLANYVTGFVPLLQPLCSCCDPSEGRVHSLRHSRGREEYPFETTLITLSEVFGFLTWSHDLSNCFMIHSASRRD